MFRIKWFGQSTIRLSGFVLMVALLLAACSGGTGTPTQAGGQPVTRPAGQTPSGSPPTETAAASPQAGEPARLDVMTHDSFAVSEDLIRRFEQENNIQLNFIPSGDAGAALNRAVLSKDAPIADVLYGVDNTFLSRALQEDIFIPYDSPLLADIPSEFVLDAEKRALPVDYGDVCLNYDKAYFTGKNLPVPQSFEDLAKPEYKGLLVVENPATSSPGLAFLMATVAKFGEPAYLDYWKQLRANGVVVASDWEAAYYTNFSGSSGRGPQPLVVSYNTSPAAEVVFSETPLEDAPTASITSPGMCFRQVEFVGILKGTRKQAAAQKLVDFILSQTFQEDMPLQMFVYPVNPQAALPAEFSRFAANPQAPASLPPEEIAAGRDRWIQAWTEAVLR